MVAARSDGKRIVVIGRIDFSIYDKDRIQLDLEPIIIEVLAGHSFGADRDLRKLSSKCLCSGDFNENSKRDTGP